VSAMTQPGEGGKAATGKGILINLPISSHTSTSRRPFQMQLLRPACCVTEDNVSVHQAEKSLVLVLLSLMAASQPA
jgi:hypothetical protein